MLEIIQHSQKRTDTYSGLIFDAMTIMNFMRYRTGRTDNKKLEYMRNEKEWELNTLLPAKFCTRGQRTAAYITIKGRQELLPQHY